MCFVLPDVNCICGLVSERACDPHGPMSAWHHGLVSESVCDPHGTMSAWHHGLVSERGCDPHGPLCLLGTMDL